jgi:chromate reductase
MTTVLGISGSLRAQSYNTALLRTAQSMVGTGVTLDVAIPARHSALRR